MDQLTSGRIKELRALSQRRGRDRAGRFIAEGVRVVEDLIDSRLEVRWILASPSLDGTSRGEELLAGAATRNLPVVRVSEDAFQEFALTDSPQGVLAVADTPDWGWDPILEPNDDRLVLVLDGVQDPGNYGTLVRTAEALGVAAAIALPGTVDAWNPKSIRASAGSAFRLPILYAKWEDARDRLQSAGYRILVSQVGGRPIAEARGPRIALVVGNEGAGVSDSVIADADDHVGVPIRGRAESLNVAAAAAIMIHELVR